MICSTSTINALSNYQEAYSLFLELKAMNDNFVHSELLNSQRVQHNADVRKTGMKYWLTQQRQGWSQYLVDREVTNNYCLELHADEVIKTQPMLNSERLTESYPMSITSDTKKDDHQGNIFDSSDSTGAQFEEKHAEEQSAIEDWLCTVAQRADTPMEVLQRLAANSLPSVRRAVAVNKSTSIEMLVDMAIDSDTKVRYAVAANHHIPTEILELLTEDLDPCVSGRARRTMERMIPRNFSPRGQ